MTRVRFPLSAPYSQGSSSNWWKFFLVERGFSLAAWVRLPDPAPFEIVNMSFEVFNTEEEMKARAKVLRESGAYVIEDFNGRVYTIKWK